MHHPWRIGRIVMAVIMVISMTLLLTDITGILPRYLNWVAGIQLIPALLSFCGLGLGIVFMWIVVTMLLGRIYCSAICPLGIMQDVAAHIGRKWRKRRAAKVKAEEVYHPNRKRLRTISLIVWVVLMLFPVTGWLAHIIEPYSAYGRIAHELLGPLVDLMGNGIEKVAEHYGKYLLYPRKVVWTWGISLVIAVVTFVLLMVNAFTRGRLYCNTFCPVGTLLSYLSERTSMIRPVIDTDKCNGCTACGRQCKANAIDMVNHQIDMAQCVACYDCMDYCKQGAIHMEAHTISFGDLLPKKNRPQEKQTADQGRRRFLGIMGGLLATLTLSAQRRKMDGGLAHIEEKKIPERSTPVLPAGSHSLRHFTTHCTGCQLCVSVCPEHVLRPSTDLTRLMQPEMQFDKSYCPVDCHKCADVCPTNAIQPIEASEKTAIHIGHAVWIKENCLIVREGVNCAHCEEVCPAGAIQMVDGGRMGIGGLIPSVDESRCIGCGKCEYLCPSRPFSAIYVEGLDRQIEDK